MTIPKVIGTPFQPGQSGNPSGRPKVTEEWRAKCREFMATKGGFEVLMDIANGKGDKKDQLKAIMFVADHAYGKAVTQIASPEGDDFDKLKIVIQRDDRNVATKDNGNLVGVDNAVANVVINAASEEEDEDDN